MVVDYYGSLTYECLVFRYWTVNLYSSSIDRYMYLQKTIHMGQNLITIIM